MKLEDLQKKTEKELRDMVVSLKEKGQELHFQLAAGKIKNTRELRAARKNIAQVETILSSRKH